MNQKVFVLLGKTGDLCSFLPLAYDYHQKGERIAIMVAKQYSDLLDGVGYCDKIVYDGDCWEIDKAYEQATKLSSNVCCVQTAGPEDLVRKFTFQPNGQEHALNDSFQKESWRLAGRIGIWKEQPPLVFDRRDPEREANLLPPVKSGRKKKLVIVAAAGESAPFPYKDLLWQLLNSHFTQFRFIDLSKLKAARFYDLLGLYKVAHCIIATDSAPLHLAYACPDLPVIALINDQPSLWHGSVYRPNHLFHCRYGDFPKRAVEMLEVIENIGSERCWSVQKHREGKIIHVWSRYEETEANEERRKEACATWNKMEMVDTPVELGAFGRNSKNKLKDEQRYPFVKDVIRLALLRAEEKDTIILTRSDTAFNSGLELSTPCYAHRTIRKEGEDSWHPACDLFAFTKQWWIEHEREYPQDMILGLDPWWHRVMLELFKKHGAKELPFAVYRLSDSKGVPVNEGWPYVQNNQKLYNAFMAQHGIQAMFPKVSEQVECVHVNRKALYPWGYNCSLTRWKDGYLLAYRHHGEKNLRTQLAIATLDQHFNVTNNRPVEMDSGFSFEDPRFFMHQQALHMSFVKSVWPVMPPNCMMQYARLVEGQKWMVENLKQDDFQKNDGSGLQKNWLYFEHRGELFCIYESSPKQTVFKVSEQIDTVWETNRPHWRWGDVKGGTVPVPYEGKLLRFFHSTLDNEPYPYRRRYYIGAMLMEPEPPFTVLRVSIEPIIRGSELDDLDDDSRRSCVHFKPKVCFPCGLVETDGAWLLSMGINDSSCVIAKIKPENLKL